MHPTVSDRHLVEATALPIVTVITRYKVGDPSLVDVQQSLSTQTFQQWEWLIVDDGNPDSESLALKELAAHDQRIRVVRNAEPIGPGASRNAAAAATRGPFILYLSQEDILEPTAIEKMVWFLESNDKASIVTGHAIVEGPPEEKWEGGFHDGFNLFQRSIPQSTVMLRRIVHESLGGFHESDREDLMEWDFWIRCAGEGFWANTIPDVLYRSRRSASNRERLMDYDLQAREAGRRQLQSRHKGTWEQAVVPTGVPEPGSYDLVRPDAPLMNRLDSNSRTLLMIVPWLTMGGADKYNLDLLRSLRARSWQVTIAATLDTGFEWEHEFQRHTPDIFALHRFLRPADYPRFLRYLIESRRPEAVLVTNSELGYLLLPFLRFHCPDPVYLDYTHMEDLDTGHGGYPHLANLYMDNLDASVVSSAHLARWRADRGADLERISVCYTGVDVDRWRPDEQVRSTMRKELGLDDETAVIIFAGRLTAQKQPMLFGQTIEALSRIATGFVALVVGDGEESAPLADFLTAADLERHVRLFGAQPYDRVRQLMQAADIFFLPSSWEGIALTIYEAMACGLAVVGAAVGGQAELVTDGAGILIERNQSLEQAQQYAEVLAELVQNRALAQQLGAVARERVVAEFGRERMTENLIGVIDTAKEKKGPEPGFTAALALSTATQAIEYTRMTRVADQLWAERLRSPLKPQSHAVELLQLEEQVARLSNLASELSRRLTDDQSHHQKELELARDTARETRQEAERANALVAGLQTTSTRLASDKERLEDELRMVYTSRAWRVVSALRGLKYGIRDVAAAPMRLARALRRAKVTLERSTATDLPFAATRSEPSCLLSVVIPVFNKGWDLLGAIESVITSTLTDVEIVVWDDGSTDSDTIAALQEAADKPGVSVFHGPNRGVVAARNSAMAASTGRFISCLDPDDRVDPTYFEKAVSLLLSDPDLGIAYPWVKVSGDQPGLWETEDLSPGLIRTANHVPVSAVFRREAYVESGGFSQRMADGYEDWEFWATLAELGFQGKVIREPLFHYMHQSSTDSSRDAKARQVHPELVTKIQRLHPGLTNGPTKRRPPASSPSEAITVGRRYRRGIGRPIVLTIPWFTVGGADRVVRWLVEHWIEQGRTVVVIATEGLGEGMQDQFAELLDLTPYSYKLENFLPRPEWEQFVMGVVSALDVPILFNIGSNWLYEHLAVLKASFPDMTVIDQQFNEVGHLAANSRNAKAIDLTVAAYESLATLLQSDGRKPGAVRTIHIGVEKQGEVSLTDKVEFRSSLGIPADAKLVLWVGRLSVEKRPEWIVRLAEGIGNAETRFLIVGDGPMGKELGRRITACPWIVWKRHVDSLDVAYAAADLLTVTSTVEGVPLTLMEALTAGVPVVATAVGGIPEFEDVVGLDLVSIGDFEGFQSAVVARLMSQHRVVELNGQLGLDEMLRAYDSMLLPDA